MRTYKAIIEVKTKTTNSNGVVPIYSMGIHGGEGRTREEDAAAVITEESDPEGKTMHCVVGGAHAFILRISSFFGLAPLKFESRGNGYTVTISNAMCAYSYVFVTALVVFTVLGLVAEINAGVEVSVRMSSQMSQVVSACDVLVVVLTAGAGVYGAPRRMRGMFKFMKSVASVDINLGAHYSVLTERKLCAILLAILVFFSGLLIDDFCLYALQAQRVNRTWQVMANYIGFYLLWYVVMILELQFAFTALSVRARFQAVNDALCLTARNIAVPVPKAKVTSCLNVFAIRLSSSDERHCANVSLNVDAMIDKDNTVIVRNADPWVIRKMVEVIWFDTRSGRVTIVPMNAAVKQSPEVSPLKENRIYLIIVKLELRGNDALVISGEPRLVVPPCEAIRRLACLHGSLCDVVHRIDNSYGLPLIVILISTLLHLIVTPYFLIMEMIVSSNRVHFLVLQFLWCATHMLRMFVVVEPSHHTIVEGKRTEELICRLMTSVPSTGMLPSRLELFSRQLMLQTVSYSPMGMCTLDRPLVVSVLGAVTTYLVILLQFQRYETS